MPNQEPGMRDAKADHPRRFREFIISEHTVITAIIVNSIALFFLSAERHSERWGSIWSLIDYACVIYFMAEIGFKMRKDGVAVFFGRAWNRFDFIVVALSLPVLLAPVYNVQDWAVVLLLRMGRLFRLCRLLWFVPHRDHIWAGIKRALHASIGVFFAIILLNVILSIGATMLFGELAPEHFGNPLLSMFTTFRLFTLDGWSDIPGLLAERAHSVWWEVGARVYFVVTVVSGGLIGLSLANAVFVDQMVVDNTDPIEAKVDTLTDEIRRLREEVRELKAGGDVKK
jgi:voltage-gated sodium channel